MRVIITGGTGLIGRALTKRLSSQGYEVIILSRSPQQDASQPSNVKKVQWDAATAEGWGYLADGAHAIVNLAGENIAGESVLTGRWTEERKKRIYTSRVNAGRAVVEAIQAATEKPKVLIQASGIDYYRPDLARIITEEDGPGSDFLSQVCFDWEASTVAVEAMGVRRCVIRSGIVLTNEGGAWPRIVLPFKLFAGGPIGSGKQYWSWIHLDDEVGAIEYLLKNEQAKGVYNLTAPEPLQNWEFASRLGKVMSRPAFFPVPAPALQIAFGEMSMLLLGSRRVLPKRLQELGYTFKFPQAEAAFKELT
jgi:uncharacterized protein (TIGR01777 family)